MSIIRTRASSCNLVENALKYGRQAAIEISQEDRSLRIAVDDQGPGLPDTELEKVFEPFYRIESSRSRDTGGGLGLAIVR